MQEVVFPGKNLIFTFIYMKINKIIQSRRKSLGITQKELAEKIGTTNVRISEIENGKYALGSERLEKILEVLHLSIQPKKYE